MFEFFLKYPPTPCDKLTKKQHFGSMITRAKKSVSLSYSLLEELVLVNKNMNISQFIETALIYYIGELKKQERIKGDIEIINANSTY